jgi:glycosyltransferase involved in cell wall biosynthesis
MQKKLKILMCSEASYLNSGFSTYAKEILSRLYNTGKYEIAEFASYGKTNDPRDHFIKWKFYANAPQDNDPKINDYNNNPENQFGKWRFERVLIDFKPDIVFDIRDYWMHSYQQVSPLRPYYHWAPMPTVDSCPQQEDWIDTYLSADAVFTYSDFGRDVLLQQSNQKIKYIDTASPGVDLEVFKPMQKAKTNIRQTLGVPENSFVVGTIVRNQKRKLIPELCETIRTLLDKNTELSNNLYLYIHTSYPDAGWDLPQILKEYKVYNRVLFTYLCNQCSFICSMPFSGPRAVCKKCGNQSLGMPNVNNGIPSVALAHVINTFDLYVQYAICEGFGMPQVEAASCGVPIASVDYSAMSDIVNKLNGYPIKVAKFFKEMETKAIRVYPDNDSLVSIIEKFYSMPEILKQQKQHETRQLTEKYYNWDNIAKKWEAYFDRVELTGIQGRWNERLQTYAQIPEEIINTNIDNYTFVYSVIQKYLPNHPIINSIMPLNIIKDLDYGFIQNGINIVPYTRKHFLNTINQIISNHNITQNALINENNLQKEDFILYAEMKERIK